MDLVIFLCILDKDLFFFIANNLKNLGGSSKNKPSKGTKVGASKNSKPGENDDEEDIDLEEKDQFDQNLYEDDGKEKVEYKDDLVEIIEDPLLGMNELPNFFHNQSKRKQAKYGNTGKESKSSSNIDHQNLKTNFLDMRRQEILEDESKKKT